MRLVERSILSDLGRAMAVNPPAPSVGVGIPPNRSRQLVLRQTGQTTVGWFWSIEELRLWRRPT
jgi:hypothetical protein